MTYCLPFKNLHFTARNHGLQTSFHQEKMKRGKNYLLYVGHKKPE